MLENKYDKMFYEELQKLSGNTELLLQIYTNATLKAYLNGVIEGSKI